MEEGKLEVKAGAPLVLRDIARTRSALAEALRGAGVRSATVNYRIEDISKTEKKVVFLIDEGARSRSSRSSSRATPRSRRRRCATGCTNEVAVFSRLLSDNTVYSQANYEADVEGLKRLYQSKGFKDVVVKDPILDVYVVNPTAKPTKLKRRVRSTFPSSRWTGLRHPDPHLEEDGQRTAGRRRPVDGDSDGVLRSSSGTCRRAPCWTGLPHRGAGRDGGDVQVARVYLLDRGSPVPGGRRPQGDIDIRMFEGEKFYLAASKWRATR